MAALVLTAAPGTARLNITTLLGEIEVSTVFRGSFHNTVSQPEIGKLGLFTIVFTYGCLSKILEVACHPVNV